MAPDRRVFFSREELLGGLPARRASTLLFAIESRTARLVERSRRAMATYATEGSEAEREQAFLEAMAEGRAIAAPAVQDLERYAPQWAPLVPTDRDVRAALARLLGKKYRFTRDVVPRLRTALGLDEEDVRAAYLRLHREPIERIYAETLSRRERLRWFRARIAHRLEHLPPFWMAFALTFTETVGSAVLALPIALAGVGVMPGIALLVILGLVNIITVAALVEAITRDGKMRYGQSYFGSLVGDYLGRPGTLVLGISLFALSVMVLVVAFVGFASVLAAATGVPVAVWAAVLFAVDLYFLKRESLDATITSALVIGAVNVVLLLLLSGLALLHARGENLVAMQLPIIDGRPLDSSILALVFGVVLGAYFGHTAAGNVAKVVLRVDPSGTALLRGNVLAMIAVVALNCLALTAFVGALGRERLIGLAGTPLTPLAEEVGPVVHVLGSLYVLLAMGIGSVHYTLGVSNQVREILPRATAGTTRTVARLVATPRGRLLSGAAPSVAVFIGTEWLLISGGASFTEPLGIVGTLAIPVLGGVFPMLMVASARRRGEYVPGTVLSLLGHPLMVAGISALFLAAVVAHGIFIWSTPVARVLALSVAALMVAVIVLALATGAFRRRAVVELRGEEAAGERARFNVTASGLPIDTAVRASGGDGEHLFRGPAGELGRLDRLREATFELPPGSGSELKVWVHRVTAEGDSIAVPVRLELSAGDARMGATERALENHGRETRTATGQALFPLDDAPGSIRIALEPAQ